MDSIEDSPSVKSKRSNKKKKTKAKKALGDAAVSGSASKAKGKPARIPDEEIGPENVRIILRGFAFCNTYIPDDT